MMYLEIYATQLFQLKLGKAVEIRRKERIEDRVIELIEKLPKEALLSIWKLEQKPEYELRIAIPWKENNENVSITIYGISQSELEALLENLKK